MHHRSWIVPINRCSDAQLVPDITLDKRAPPHEIAVTCGQVVVSHRQEPSFGQRLTAMTANVASAAGHKYARSSHSGATRRRMERLAGTPLSSRPLLIDQGQCIVGCNRSIFDAIFSAHIQRCDIHLRIALIRVHNGPTAAIGSSASLVEQATSRMNKERNGRSL